MPVLYLSHFFLKKTPIIILYCTIIFFFITQKTQAQTTLTIVDTTLSNPPSHIHQTRNNDSIFYANLVQPLPYFYTPFATFTKPFYIFFQFNIEEGWHLYWKNAGDAGLPLHLQLNINEAEFKIGKPVYSVPQYYKEDGFINYVYQKNAYILLPIEPTANIANTTAEPNLKITANMQWQVCNQKCINQTQALTFDNQDVNPNSLLFSNRKVQQTLTQFPQPLTATNFILKSTKLKKRKNKGTITLNFANKKMLLLPQNAQFFADTIPNANIQYNNISLKKNTITIPFTIKENTTLPPKFTLKGLLITPQGKGYEVITSVK